jgi:hypothetical protein
MERRRPTKKEIVDRIVAEGIFGQRGNLHRLLTKKEIVDLIIAEATFGQFKGDKRDGATPPITIQNFLGEGPRYAAKALRARLSRLSFAQLLTEGFAALDYVGAKQERLSQMVELAERNEREEAAQGHRQRQAELGRRSRLQPAILAAARHFRQIAKKSAKKSAKEAWLAIKHKPYETDDGSVVIVAAKGRKEEMVVWSRRGQQKRSGIGFGSWQDRYWPKADSRSTR